MTAKNATIIDLLNGVNLAVATTGTVYSKSFTLPAGNPSFAFEYQATSPGTVTLKLELEQGNEVPDTESVADLDYVVPDGAAELDNVLSDELTHIKAYEPAATAYARFKITGSGSNDALTVINKLKVSYIG